MECKESNQDGEHDFDELGECVFCGRSKLKLCYEELYGIINEHKLSEDQKGAISFIISYSRGVKIITHKQSRR